MVKEIVSKHNNIILINFNHIFLDCVEKGLLKDLNDHGLLDKPKNVTVRKFFFHHIIFCLCNHLLNLNNKEKAVVFYEDNNIYSYEISQYLSEEVVSKYMHLVFKKIEKLLPIRVMKCSFTFEYLHYKISKKTGFGTEIMLKAKSIVDNKDFTKFTYEKCKKFTEREGLQFLNKSFFNTLKSKQLLFI